MESFIVTMERRKKDEGILAEIGNENSTASHWVSDMHGFCNDHLHSGWKREIIISNKMYICMNKSIFVISPKDLITKYGISTLVHITELYTHSKWNKRSVSVSLMTSITGNKTMYNKTFDFTSPLFSHSKSAAFERAKRVNGVCQFTLPFLGLLKGLSFQV